MKKIVALVLSLVMVLGLATTAFAAPDKYDLYLADDGMAAQMLLEKVGDDGFANVNIKEFAATTNKDGSGNVAYLEVTGATYKYATKTTAPTIASYAVCEAGETDVLYYVNFNKLNSDLVFKYVLEVKAFSDFGLKCGQVNNVDYTIVPGEDYFYCPITKMVHQANAAVAQANANWLLDGVVVSGGAGMKVTDHTFVANDFKYDSTLKANVPTSAICTTCLETTTAIYKDGKVPAQKTPYEMKNAPGYWAVEADTVVVAPEADGEKVESAETFDAGIAMYVGMSVMAAAGSAVVLKKKD